MARRLLSLVLIISLVLPARAVAEVLLALIPASTAVTPAIAVERSKPVKICPCTGRPGCNCCGCGDDEDDAQSTPPGEPVDEKEQGRDQQSDISGPRWTCSCQPSSALFSSCDYLPNRGLKAIYLSQPQPEAIWAYVNLYLSASLPIDSPPPKDQV